MKRIIRIILISVCLLQPAGLLVIYKLQQAYIKCRMQYEVNQRNSGFENFAFPVEEFQKIRINKHEFSLAGKMYDIKSIQVTGNNMLVTAIHDTWEETVIGLVKQLFKINPQQNNPMGNRILNFITSSYITSELTVTLNSDPGHLIKFPAISDPVISQDREVSTPPPKPSC